MPAPLHSREEVIKRLSAVFREQGYEGASLKKLSDATGLGRSSLYHYFPKGKEDMAAAVLEEANHWIVEHVIGVLETDLNLEDRVTLAGERLMDFYAQGRKSCLLELFVVGDAQGQFGDQVKGAFVAIKEGFQSIVQESGLSADEAKIRAEDAIIAIQGALIMSRGMDSPDLFKRIIDDLPRKLLATP